MSVAYNHKVNRMDIYKQIKKMIEESPTGEAEVSASELADQFNIQPPTMDYHIKKLVKEGYLVDLKKRGRNRRKVYTLPKNVQEEDQTQLVYDQNDIQRFKEILKEKLHIPNDPELKKKIKKAVHQDTEEIQEKEQENVSYEYEDNSKEEKEKSVLNESLEDLSYSEKHSSLDIQKNVKELTLDEQIERFLKESKNVATAEQLLSREDREILSVINESIQQHIVYLKDLSDQLSTVQNKKLIQQLIDERNSHLELLKRLEQENEALLKQVQENKGKYDLDPNRVRLIQQNLISTLDSYLDQPNHALALGRREFRANYVKLLNDAFRYVLNLEK